MKKLLQLMLHFIGLEVLGYVHCNKAIAKWRPIRISGEFKWISLPFARV